MFKFTASVKTSVFVSVFLTALTISYVHADDARPAAPPPAAETTYNDSALKELLKVDCAPGKEDSPKCQQTRQAVLTGGKADATTSCTSNADSKLKDASTAFTAACAKANIGTGDDIVSCGKKMANCDVGQGASISSDASKPYDTSSAAKAKLGKCPAYAGLDLKVLRDQIDQQRKSVSEMDKEIPGLQKDLLAGTREANKSLASAKKEAASNLKEHNKELRDITRQASDKNKAAQDKMNQLQAEMTGKYAQITQVKQNEIAAGATLEETKVKIRLNCYNIASAQVLDLQKEVVAKAALGAYNRGGQASMLSYSGMSSRDAWKTRATEFYGNCMTSDITTESFKSANNAYKVSMGAFEQQVRNINAEIDGLQKQLLQVASPNPCPNVTAGPAPETDVCRADREKKEDLQQSMDGFKAQQGALNDEMVQTQQDSAESNSLNKETLAQRKKDVENEHQRLTNLQEYYAMKYNASGGRETEQGALNDAFGRFAELKAISKSVKECGVPGLCDQKDATGGFAGKIPGKCTEEVINSGTVAQNFLKNIGDPDYEPLARKADAQESPVTDQHSDDMAPVPVGQ